MQSKHSLIAFAALIALMFAFAPAASAHKTAYTPDGKIKILWGFLNEPAVTWTKTGLDLRVSDNATGAPILGAADTMEVHFRIGDEEMHFEDLAGQHGNPGAYTQVVTLTQPGLYSIAIHGTINGTAVDMVIPGAHEVESVDETFFPKPAANPYESGDSGLSTEVVALKARLDALEAKLKTQSETPASVTPQPTVSGSAPAPGLGMLALAVAIVASALILRRRK